jgi:magnesium-transporting ATPase (P-type)
VSQNPNDTLAAAPHLRPVISSAALVLSNCIPVIGVAFLGWDLFTLMALFWAENVVIGLYNVLRILSVKPHEPVAWLAKIFTSVFFTVHYGGFCLGHGVFVLAFFGGKALGQEPSDQETLEILQGLATNAGFVIGLLALAASHGVSYVQNFIRSGEYLKCDPQELMMRPYGRIFILHVALIAGGILAMAMQDAVWIMLLLTVLKIGMDLRQHWAERDKLQHRDGAVTR